MKNEAQPFQLTLLGVSGALPARGLFPSAQALTIGNRAYLIDCGEGAQIQMQALGISPLRIHQIFISHLHGDHFYGLIGLLGSMALAGRDKPLDIFGPRALEEIIQVQLKHVGPVPFPLRFQPVDPGKHQLIYENKAIEVYTLPLIHRSPAAGFLFREKPRLRKMRPEMIAAHDIPYQVIPAIKAGADYQAADGSLIPNAALTLDPPLPRSYAYCSDTAFNENLPALVKGVDLLYHEATFCDDREDLAAMTGHSTARQAALIAQRAGVGHLVLGHYSSRYPDFSPFLAEAREVFPRTSLGMDGAVFRVPLNSAQTDPSSPEGELH
jgi:ribonuclease Z